MSLAFDIGSTSVRTTHRQAMFRPHPRDEGRSNRQLEYLPSRRRPALGAIRSLYSIIPVIDALRLSPLPRLPIPSDPPDDPGSMPPRAFATVCACPGHLLHCPRESNLLYFTMRLLA